MQSKNEKGKLTLSTGSHFWLIFLVGLVLGWSGVVSAHEGHHHNDAKKVPASKPVVKKASATSKKAPTSRSAVKARTAKPTTQPAEHLPYPRPKIRYNYKPKEIVHLCKANLKQAKASIQALVDGHKDTSKITFKNAVAAFESILVRLDESIGPFYLLRSVSPDPKVRRAGGQCLRVYFGFWSRLFARSDLYKLMKHASANSKKANLDAQDLRLLSETLKAFIRNGAALGDKKRKLVADLNAKMSALSLQFRRHLSQDKTYAVLSKAELAGVPKSLFSQLKRNKKGEYLLKVRVSSLYLAFLRNATSPEARKKVLLAYENAPGIKNTKVLEKVIALRHQVANLLGFRNHAHYVLDDRMAKKPKTVLTFLEGLRKKLRIKMDQELKVLLKMKQKDFPKAKKVHAWDWRFYAYRLKKTKYSLDNETIRKYFPMNHVMKSVFDIYQQLLGVTFHEIKPAKAWHPDVRLFAVVDKRSKKLVAHFYLDLFPRPGKYSHFAAFGFQSGRRLANGAYKTPVSSVVGNWRKPAKGQDSLLSHGEVQTFFHEFGHIMHQTLTQAKYGSMAGTSVKRDFVEAPSQMLENWVWKPKFLKKISKHYKTGKPLPDKLIARMIRAKHVNGGLRNSRQIFYATVDMTFHTMGAKVDTAKVWRQVVKKVMPVAQTKGTHPAGGFGHLMGYSAGYYGYMWSKVYAQDMFTVFEKLGLLSQKAGMRYRKWILEPGGTLDPMDLIKGFLKRNPNSKAFYKELGIQ